MKKKRKRWLIGAGVLGFFVLLFAVALLMERNSPGAKLERALDLIIAENELELDLVSNAWGSRGEWVTEYYLGEPINQENKERTLAQLKEACPSCTFEVLTQVEGNRWIDAPDNPAFYEFYYVSSSVVPSIDNFVISFDDKGISDGRTVGDPARSSSLAITRRSDTDPWSFLKRLWPW